MISVTRGVRNSIFNENQKGVLETPHGGERELQESEDVATNLKVPVSFSTTDDILYVECNENRT